MSTLTTTAPVANLPESREQIAAARKPAPKAPAKKAAPKAQTATTKITWKNDGEPDAKGQAEGTGVCGERTYLGENLKSGKAAWAKCVEHNRSAK